MEFLRQRNQWFDMMRTDIYKSKTKILFCTVFDILVTVMPVVFCIADYKNGLYWQAFNIILTIVLLTVHYLDGSHEKRPIISNWFMPGGSNPGKRFYEVITD